MDLGLEYELSEPEMFVNLTSLPDGENGCCVSILAVANNGQIVVVSSIVSSSSCVYGRMHQPARSNSRLGNNGYSRGAREYCAPWHVSFRVDVD